MQVRPEVVVTGLGLISPIGIGRESFWTSLCEAHSGIGPLAADQRGVLPLRILGAVRDFDPKEFVSPRKTLKVMSRDMQMGVAASQLGYADAGLDGAKLDPERFGMVFGADRICDEMKACVVPESVVNGKFHFERWSPAVMQTFPLRMLLTLPNMVACHASIALDARAHNNTIHHGDVSALLAIQDAVRVIERGWADVMIAGGASSKVKPYDLVHDCVVEPVSSRNGKVTTTPRPFDADRDGQVFGEGAATLVLESRAHAEARGAPILASIAGLGCASDPWRREPNPQGIGLRHAMQAALREAKVTPSDVGHVNAHGLGTVEDDPVEAAAIREVLGDTPVTALKSFFGNLCAAGGAMEMAASVLALKHGQVPVTLNFEQAAPDCPVNVIAGKPLSGAAPVAMIISQNRTGQAAAIVLRS